MSKSIEERKKILVVGVGSIGERHARCFRLTDRAEVSVCDTNQSLANRVAKAYDARSVYFDYQDALAGDDQAVVIATPANLHVAMAQAAVDMGKHVLIEKPLGTSMADVERLRDEAQRKDRQVLVGYVLRSHPALAGMKRAIGEKRFGQPVHIYACAGQHFPTYRPAYRDIYYNDHTTGGGAIQDALTHLLDAGQWLVGPIDRLVADAAHQVIADVDVEDTVNVLARHGNVLASYALNQYQAPNELTLTVVCEQGTARFEYHKSAWRWMDPPDSTWHNHRTVRFSRDQLFVDQANHFLDVIERRCHPVCTLAEGIQSLRANLAVLNSATAGPANWYRLSGE